MEGRESIDPHLRPPKDLERRVRDRGLGKRVREGENVWVTGLQDLKVIFGF